MRYDEAYVRNIGVFSEAEQNILRNSKVTIAGLGGVGGYAAVALARHGIGELSIMDPGEYDPPDMNRQYGAREDTMERNKAEVMQEELKKINPFLKVNISTNAILESNDLERFVEGSSIVIDAIDAFARDQRELYAQVARKLGLYNVNFGVCVGEQAFSARHEVYHPDGMHVEEVWSNLSEPPEECTQEVCTNILAGGWAAFTAAALITEKHDTNNFPFAPFFREFNLLTGESRLFRYNFD